MIHLTNLCFSIFFIPFPDSKITTKNALLKELKREPKNNIEIANLKPFEK